MIDAPVLASCLPFLDEAERRVLCNYMEYASYPAHETIINAADPGDFMGFVVTGRLAVKKQTEFPGKFVLLALLQAGAMVGEIAALGSSPRSATVVTLEETELLIIPHAKFRQLLADDVRLGVKLLEKIIAVIGSRLQRSSERLAQLL